MKNRQKLSQLCLGAVFVTASTAMAADNKTFNGAEFRCYTPQACPNIAYSPNGAESGPNGSTGVFFPLMRDLGADVKITVIFKDRLASSCVVNMYDFNGLSGVAYTLAPAPGVNNQLTRVSGGAVVAIPGSGITPPFVYCSLAANARLTGLDYNEL